MGLPITTTGQGICFAFPDVCQTPSPGGPVPVPYPNIGQLSDAIKTTTAVYAGGNPVVVEDSEIPVTTGDEAGSASPTKGKVEFVTFSQTVFAQGKKIVRLSDTTKQNNGNAVGQVLGGLPTVLVG